MGRTSCEKACGACGGGAADCANQSDVTDSTKKSKSNRQIRNKAGNIAENSFSYETSNEKCRFCGAALSRRIDAGYASSFDGGDPDDIHGVRIISQIGVREIDRSAKAYISAVKEKGCGGICVQRDTRACDGKRCKTCSVFDAGLCCKNYLINCRNSNILERDGGDYRSIMACFINRLQVDIEYDDGIREKLLADIKKADKYSEGLRRQISGVKDKNLIFDWRDYTLNDLAQEFPQADRRPIRIEWQILIYIYHNFRYPINLEHAEARFLVPGFAINRYLRSFFGHSFSGLLSKTRNDYSKLLLRIPFLRIGEIGEIAGYKSHYHYSLSFKRCEGISPKEYRQAAIDKTTPV